MLSYSGPEVPGEALDVAVSRRGSAVVVAIAGELDLLSAIRLRPVLHDLIVGQGNLSITLDLAGLGFVDSAGLRVLIEAKRRLAARGGTLALTGLTPSIKRVLDLTRLAHVSLLPSPPGLH